FVDVGHLEIAIDHHHRDRRPFERGALEHGSADALLLGRDIGGELKDLHQMPLRIVDRDITGLNPDLPAIPRDAPARAGLCFPTGEAITESLVLLALPVVGGDELAVALPEDLL